MPGDTPNINNKAVIQNTYDAIVIGSGISGGWAAKELTEKGLKVLMLERGRPREHIKDYVSANKDPWEFPHGGKAPLQYKKDNPVISRDWAMYGTAAQEAIIDSWANEKDCIAVDWPIRYNEIAPWYDYVEKFAGISGSKEGLAHLPDGQFLPPMDLNCVEKDVAERLKKFYNGQRHLFIGRVANLTAPIPGRTQCQFRN